ncbi:DHS-like NAD/FAD-binding domain-containing protein [Xylona heveae TC161]|uniref:DHS-like NAD/FAD-binding domain-containing protein n=1 Tax=Xylona heveae (strain CBS 132557 / TC161) TaxID=1328760 RepID=A0A165ILB0_XYLHT|nr:DHS-like NAD/FAD-binding domain-containing protein [Xylona heveae TC161]KZF25060.1 DHS-like NAD/FAD-binding domain-containing protein [Xylona heveae TC161]
MQKPLMRIPYTGPLPPPLIVPRSANTLAGAVSALAQFISAPASKSWRPNPITGPLFKSSPVPNSFEPPSISSSAAASSSSFDPNIDPRHNKTVLLTGAGISVASGLADYRGPNGTYTLNKTYRPIYFNEFIHNHEARKRYWARSFLGWPVLSRSRPNNAHWAVKTLGDMGWLSGVITQNVDSFHPLAHPTLPTLELHGYLRSLVCLTCKTHMPRQAFQDDLARLNPAWADFLNEMLASGALLTENPDERRKKGLRTNPDGDVDLPDAPYSTFRYPACPTCLADPSKNVHVDKDGAWVPPSSATANTDTYPLFSEPSRYISDVDPSSSSSTSSSSSSSSSASHSSVSPSSRPAAAAAAAAAAGGPGSGPSSTIHAGILKPAVVMFGESISPETKHSAEDMIDNASRILVVGSSLATYSAWRLVKRATDRGMPVGVLNMGGVRGEEVFFADLISADNSVNTDNHYKMAQTNRGEAGVRCGHSANEALPLLVEQMKDIRR